MSFEEVLQKINKFVTIDKDSPRVYMKDFDNIRHKIFSEMKNASPAFEIIAGAPRLGGSYADGLKVSEPSKFVLIFELEFPDQSLIEMQRAEHSAGLVTLNITKLLKNSKGEKQNQSLYWELQELVDADGYLLLSKFQRWIQTVVGAVSQRMVIDDMTYFITRRDTPRGHTLNVNVESRQFSVDLVPVLRFPTSTWPAERPCPEQSRDKVWIAVPKLLQNIMEKTYMVYDSTLYWNTLFVAQENYLIGGINFIKPSIRLLKKLRNRHGLTHLKSYYIKTVFLWIMEEKQREGHRNFGREGLGVTFLYGFERLLDYFKHGRLPFFWDESFDILNKLTEAQRSNIYRKLKVIHRDILSAKNKDANNLLKVFLPDEERRKLEQLPWSVVLILIALVMILLLMLLFKLFEILSSILNAFLKTK